MRLSRLFAAALMLISAAGVQADIVQRTAPEPANQKGFVLDEVNYMWNVKAKKFFTEGNAWGTQASLADQGLKMKITASTEDDGTGEMVPDGMYLLNDSSLAKKAWKLVFFDSADAMFVDLGNQANFYWQVEDNGATFRLYAGAKNPTYNWETYPDMYMGYFFDETDPGKSTLSPFLAADVENNYVDWTFVPEADYEAYQPAVEVFNKAEELRAVIEMAKEMGTNTDEYDAVYNNPNATMEELEAALKGVQVSVIQGIIGGATNEEPINVSEAAFDVLHIAYNFDDNSIVGWNKAFTAGNHQAANANGAANAAETGVHYENWDGGTFKGKVYAIAENLPAGMYKLSTLAFATQSYDNPEKGAWIYAKSGDKGDSVRVNTDKIYLGRELTVSIILGEPGSIEYGMNLPEATDNWVGLDNTCLWYYGPVNEDPDKLILDMAVESALNVYSLDDLDDIVAYIGDKEAYRAAIEEAQAATENYVELKDKVNAALAQLKKSVEAYTKLASKFDEWQKLAGKFEFTAEDWMDFCDFIGGMLPEREDYPEVLPEDLLEDQNYTIEQVEAYIAQVDDLYQAAVANSMKPGDDISALLTNPGFETGLSNGKAEGWTVDAGTGGNLTPGPLGSDLDQLMIDAGIEPNHCFEGWHRYNWDVYQEIKNAPAGVYQISCQGYVRCEKPGYTQGEDVDPNTVPIMLYMNNSTSSFPSIYSEEIAEEHFLEDGTLPVIEGHSWTGAVANTPNSMGAASLCFAWGMYKVNTFGLVQPGQSMRIGVKNTSSEDWWCIWDNFQITYQGFLPEYVKPALEAALATIDLEKPMAKSIVAAANALKDEAKAAIDANDGEQMFEVLVKVNDLKSSITESVALFAKLSEAAENLNTIATESESAAKEEALALYAEIIDHIDARDIENADAEAYMDKIAEMLTKLNMPDDVESASDENPVDMTSVIVNPDFETGTAEGWTYAFIDVTNIGFQNNSTYTSTTDDAVISNFIEGWRNGSAIGDGSLEQTIIGLPEGTYTLSADIIANAQYRSDSSTAIAEDGEGIFLFADEADGNKSSLSVATLNGNPLRFTLTFKKAAKSNALTIGLKAVNATANWLAADNFVLTYYGKESAKEANDDASGINSTLADNATIQQVYSLNGVRMNTLKKGVNIVRQQMSDGTVRVVKIVVK